VAEKYRASGEFPISGALKGLVICVLVGIVVGGLAHLLGRYFYLLILFPIAMGFAGMMALTYSINTGKIRNISIAILLGLICSVSLYGSMHVFDYLQFKSEIKASITAEDPELTANEEGIQAIIDGWLETEVGDTGFMGYMKFSAKQGVSIGKVGRDGGNIGKVGTYVYWLIEFLIIAGFILSGSTSASEPFCSPCDTWYEKMELIPTTVESVEEITSAVDRHDFGTAAQKLDPTDQAPCAMIEYHRCPNCQNSDAVMKIQGISIDKKGNKKVKDLYESVIPFSGMATICDGVENQQEGQPPQE